MVFDARTKAYLQALHFGVLATLNADNTIQQTVMWYDLDGEDILMNTKAGRVKDHNLRRNPQVSLCVEDGYRYVTIRGTVALIEDQAIAQADIARLARRYHPNETLEAEIARFQGEQRITVRLHPTSVVVDL